MDNTTEIGCTLNKNTVIKLKFLPGLLVLVIIAACRHTDYPFPKEQASTFTEISSTDLGEVGAAEISAFDPATKKLFTVTNSGSTIQIDVLDFSDPAQPVRIGGIDISPYGGGVNSVAVSDGKLAAAVEGFEKTDAGKIVIFKTDDYAVIKPGFFYLYSMAIQDYIPGQIFYN